MKENLGIAIRYYIYQYFVRTARAPTVAEVAQHFDLPVDKMEEWFRILHQKHFIYLDPDTLTIRMANPFSGVPTAFSVQVGKTTYWANCAWDMLGIPAALERDGIGRAMFEDTKETVTITVDQRNVIHRGGLVHFPLPVRRWYENLILT